MLAVRLFLDRIGLAVVRPLAAFWDLSRDSASPDLSIRILLGVQVWVRFFCRYGFYLSEPIFEA